jgi:hypothetical protein
MVLVRRDTYSKINKYVLMADDNATCTWLLVRSTMMSKMTMLWNDISLTCSSSLSSGCLSDDASISPNKHYVPWQPDLAYATVLKPCGTTKKAHQLYNFSKYLTPIVSELFSW